MTLEARVDGKVGDFRLALAFTAPAGVTALLGRSGSGKTTLLRWLAGLIALPGTLNVNGEVWQDEHQVLPPHRRRVGFVMQGANLLPHKTVRQNLAYAARRAGQPHDPALIDRTGIGPLLDRMPATLSGGEAQRAALARALACRPALLLLDEPLSALDVEAKAALSDYLAELLPELAIPVLLVTHDSAEATALASRRLTLTLGEPSPPHAKHGEGDQPQAGGGEMRSAAIARGTGAD